MPRSNTQLIVKNRNFGIFVLVTIQVILGLIHLFFGLTFSSTVPRTYNVYTIVYGSFTLVFSYLIWKGKRLGWMGIVAIAVFIIIIDILAVFEISNLLHIPAPKEVAIGEIPFSILVLVYLFQKHIRSKYRI